MALDAWACQGASTSAHVERDHQVTDDVTDDVSNDVMVLLCMHVRLRSGFGIITIHINSHSYYNSSHILRSKFDAF